MTKLCGPAFHHIPSENACCIMETFLLKFKRKEIAWMNALTKLCEQAFHHITSENACCIMETFLLNLKRKKFVWINVMFQTDKVLFSTTH